MRLCETFEPGNHGTRLPRVLEKPVRETDFFDSVSCFIRSLEGPDECGSRGIVE